jgi:MFS family permease
MQPLITSTSSSAVARGEMNRFYLWVSCLVAALGGLMFGYDWVVISGADIFYEKYFNLVTASDTGWAKGCALAGCLVGALVAGALSDRYGRKRLLFALWTANFLLTYLFPSMLERFGAAGTFWLFAGICALGFVVMKVKLPETKGKTLEEIERELTA